MPVILLGLVALLAGCGREPRGYWIATGNAPEDVKREALAMAAAAEGLFADPAGLERGGELRFMPELDGVAPCYVAAPYKLAGCADSNDKGAILWIKYPGPSGLPGIEATATGHELCHAGGIMDERLADLCGELLEVEALGRLGR